MTLSLFGFVKCLQNHISSSDECDTQLSTSERIWLWVNWQSFYHYWKWQLVPTNNWYPFQSIEKLIGSIFLLIRFPTDIWMHSLTACQTVMSPRIHSGSHAMNKLHFSVANSARRVCSGISLLWHYKNLFDQTELTSTVHNYWHITLASLTIMRRTLRKS